MEDYKKLAEAGMDTNTFLKRLMGNASLVRVFVKKFTEDQTFENLKSAFEQKDMKHAEMSSHTLKGMCGNLSMNELYEMFSEQVNLIRAGEYQKAEAMMEPLQKTYHASVNSLCSWLEDN